MQLFRKRVSVIGLDIGASMIKAVKMSLRGKSFILETFALEPVEEGAIQSGEIKNPSSLAQSALKAVKRCDPHLRDVVIALPNYSILSDVLTMDLRPEKEMREAVMVEADVSVQAFRMRGDLAGGGSLCGRRGRIIDQAYRRQNGSTQERREPVLHSTILGG
jgi:Tfp pilus assembly PilM family ATPase